MQKITSILISLLLIAVLVLYVIVLTENKNVATVPLKQADSSIIDPSTIKIAFINVDSLLKNYKFYEYLESKLLAKQKSMESDLNKKMAAFEKEVQDFQKKVQLNSFLSEESARRQQQDLMMKEQNLYKLREELSLQLAKETQELEKQLLDTVTNFLKEFNADKSYNFILNKAAILHGNEALDITDTIIFLLNKRYESQKLSK
jgi:outer membrane protein